MQRIFFLLASLALLGCHPPSPAGEYAGRWVEADQSTVEVRLVLRPDGKATMERLVRWPDGRSEADSWDAEYQVRGDQIRIGSEGKLYALFVREGESLLDPSHPIGGKPIRLLRQSGKAP
ncbi:hypothetical protein MAMC_01439 [Methylacidimicrobium cyclopophantes]|uniref:Lipoprotein n=1 Tax=Methylacidimicrobium cyclopophantes TaxID=1041766 RepID=A0A5E6MM32_9BACT|nr:hypothetical protein [Methylacidimicrobium cyclopophantes]VVM07129.1 hypothetical protein MAMC_01439 [Methylacidimicrobium cyclopophantes]